MGVCFHINDKDWDRDPVRQVASQFISPPIPTLQIFPLGVIPQKAQNRFCLIYHLCKRRVCKWSCLPQIKCHPLHSLWLCCAPCQKQVRARLPHITPYLDNFLLVERARAGDRYLLLNSFWKTIADLGIPLAKEKAEGPPTRFTFLGIELDSVPGTSLNYHQTNLTLCISLFGFLPSFPPYQGSQGG